MWPVDWVEKNPIGSRPKAIPPAMRPTMHDQQHREPSTERRHDQLRREQPAARDGPHQQVAQIPPRGLARDRFAREERDHDDQQELAGESERDGRDQQARLRAEEEEEPAVAGQARADSP